MGLKRLYRNIQNDRNRKLEISTALTKAKLREPAYSQMLDQNNVDRQRVRYRESERESFSHFVHSVT